ncbi:unnamed protein product [Rhizophagus irregularis]|nr:unnamed protein product [Rhizophagus irregularis]
MLTSLLDQVPEKIKLDKLTFKDENDDLTFTTNRDEIEEHAITHYRDIGKVIQTPLLYNKTQPLREPWNSVYRPINIASKNDIGNLNKLITMEELQNAIKDLPTKKASVILSLYNYCLINEVIPEQFKLAFLYPIPKPTWWNYDINHTRPIILLDCFRKLLVKIVNSRLNYYLSTNNILQHNNQASIQGASCNKIILYIQSIIEHQKTTNNPLYLLLQDLSKAYDRIDIPLLLIALKRINIPSNIIKFVENLFIGHNNRIILADTLSDPYETKQGIIQGEIISPLLWVIYYDPMFAAINQSPYRGYNLQASLPQNIFRKEDLHEEKLELKLIGYLIDTTWFASNIKDLEANLAIADDFYSLANIKINKDKTKLLTNDMDLQKQPDKRCPFKFSNDIINIEIVPKHNNEHILGIYINVNNSPFFTYNKIKKMLHYICFNLCRKKSLIHNPIYPNILNIWDSQLRAQASLLNAQINNPITSHLIQFLILTSQSHLWANSISEMTKYFHKPLKTFNRLENLLCIFHYYNLSFIVPSIKYTVTGGLHLISYFIADPKNYFKYLNSLKNKDIFFLDQIISNDGAFLKTWKEIKRTLKSKSGRRPKWYDFLKDNIVINNSTNCLQFTVNKKSHFPSDVPKVYGEHHIPAFDSSLYDPTLTPHTQPNLLTTCPGCDLHDSFYIGDVCP